MTKAGRWLHNLLGYPWISAIESAPLRPGDLLVVHLPAQTGVEQAERIRDLLAERMPQNVNCCLMVGDDVRMEVVRVVNPADRPLQRPIGG